LTPPRGRHGLTGSQEPPSRPRGQPGTSRRLGAIAGTGVLAVLAIVAEEITSLTPARIVFGLLLVLALPGFAAVCWVLPDQEMSPGERLLASVGASLAISTCVAVLLAAVPIGLSKGSAVVTLGLGTATASICAWWRTSRSERRRRTASL
jgi:uncharacterized membrane protein